MEDIRSNMERIGTDDQGTRRIMLLVHSIDREISVDANTGKLMFGRRFWVMMLLINEFCSNNVYIFFKIFPNQLSTLVFNTNPFPPSYATSTYSNRPLCIHFSKSIIKFIVKIANRILCLGDSMEATKAFKWSKYFLWSHNRSFFSNTSFIFESKCNILGVPIFPDSIFNALRFPLNPFSFVIFLVIIYKKSK